MSDRPPLPPFSRESATAKVRAAENAWNTRDPAIVALACAEDGRWRDRSESLSGRPAIEAFLAREWAREGERRLIKELWAFTRAAIAVRFAYESRDDQGRWWRSHGNENLLFAPDGLMAERRASINDAPITDGQRLFRWLLGAHPEDHPGLTALGL